MDRKSATSAYVSAAVTAAFVTALAVACGTEDPGAGGNGTNPAGVFCGTPNEGCPCDQPGKVVECGSVAHRSGDYVSCSMGKRTCNATTWGACIGDDVFVSTKSFVGTGSPVGGSGVQPKALGPGIVCPPPPSPLSNPCDPYCNVFVDDSAGVPLPSGPVGGCNVPNGNPPAVYALLGAALRGNGACVPGVGDTCNHDYKCLGASCQEYPIGQPIGGTNPACGLVPDFTIGQACNSTGTTAGWELIVCNRGGVAALAGTLQIAIKSGAPGGALGTCAWGDTPAIAAAQTNEGRCDYNLATNPLAPGQCRSFPVSSPFCTATAGGPIALTPGANTFAVVNPPLTLLPAVLGNTGPIAECNTCNNYTGIDDATAGNPNKACTPVQCSPGPPAAPCQLPQDPAATYCVDSSSRTHNRFTTCIAPLPTNNAAHASIQPGCTTAPDNCGYDAYCPVAGGSCAFYTPGQIGTSPGVDFTMGQACGPVGGGGQNLRFTVCNRGLTGWAGGTLSVSKSQSSNPTGYPAYCGQQTNPAGAPKDGARQGTCNFAIPSGLTPGQCTNVQLQPANCPGLGATWDVDGTNLLFVNDPETGPGTNIPGPRIVESNYCNNKVSYKHQDVFACNASGACGGGVPACNTTVSGIIRDPGQNVPLPNINVYQPISTPLPAFTPGVSCDTCASVVAPFVDTTFTAVDGSFSLCITPGLNIPVVIQTGRWRRLITLPTVTAGTNTVLTPAQAHLPSVQAPGTDDIPRIAFATGSLADPVECGFAKMMGGTSQITGPGGAGRIHLYQGDGSSATVGNQPAANLWANLASLSAYDIVFLPCGNQVNGITPAQQQAFVDYTRAGGKLFMDHVTAGKLLKTGLPFGGYAPFNTTSTWQAAAFGSGGLTKPAQYRVLGTDATSNQYRSWLVNQGAYPVAGLTTPEPRPEAQNPNPASSFEWLRGVIDNNWGTTPAGNHTGSFSFDMDAAGLVAAPASGCGRVIYNSMHVNSTRGTTGGAFPSTSCTAAHLGPGLTPNEMAFEYLIFALSGCSIVPPVPPPTPLPPAPPTQYYTRDYDTNGLCPVGTRVEWQFFSWQSVVTPPASIVFQAQTASGVANPFGPPNTAASASPVPVSAGTATTTTGAVWTADADTVAYHLQNDAVPAQKSKEWLRITMAFNTGGGPLVPTLTNWKQGYSCVPAE